MRSRIIATIVASITIVGVVVLAPLLSNAARQSTTITISNNSNRQVVHVYLSSTAQDNWGPDLLSPSVIAPGGTFTLNNVDCSGADLKVVAEDLDGCFMYQVVSCGQSSTWTITNETTRDCGGN